MTEQSHTFILKELWVEVVSKSRNVRFIRVCGGSALFPEPQDGTALINGLLGPLVVGFSPATVLESDTSLVLLAAVSSAITAAAAANLDTLGLISEGSNLSETISPHE